MAKTPDVLAWKATYKADPLHIRVAPDPRAYLFRLRDGGTAVVLTRGDHLRAVQLLRHRFGVPAGERPYVTWRLLDEDGVRAARRRRRSFSWFGQEGVWSIEPSPHDVTGTTTTAGKRR